MLTRSKKHGNLPTKAIAMLSCLVCCASIPGMTSIVTVSAADVSSVDDLSRAIESGDVKLTQDITVTSPITINNNVSINLNNHKITYAGSDDANGSVIRITNGGKLTLNGNGTITGGKSTQGGGIFVGEGSEFVMNGGTITGNAATDEISSFDPISGFGREDIIIDSPLRGGGVYVSDNATFTMNGGTITGNSAEEGAGVYLLGQFNVSGSPVITENRCNKKNTYLNNVFLKEEGIINIKGSLDSTAKIGVCTSYTDLPNGYVFTNGYSRYNQDVPAGNLFTSDDTSAVVILSPTNGEAVLQSQGTYYPMELPTCSDNGVTDYWIIGDNKYIKDVNGNLLLATEDNLTLPPYGHINATRIEEGRPATYDKAGYCYRVTYCKECGKVIRKAKASIPKLERPAANCNVNVINGKLNDGSTSAVFENGAVCVATADEAPEGYKFGYWKKNGSTISYNSTYTFYVTSDNIEIEAVYVEDTDDIERYGNAKIEYKGHENDGEKTKLIFVSSLNVPNDCTILKAGIVATNDADKVGDLSVTDCKYNRFSENPGFHSYEYTWKKSVTSDDETWYVKGYVLYTDANGNEKIVYSNDTMKASVNGSEVIKDKKVLGTAVINAVRTVEGNKLQFVSVTSVPADCTINATGLVATKDAEKAQNLTAENNDYFKVDRNVGYHNYEYTWTKTNVTADQVWYARAYLEYTDADGNVQTVYGELVVGTLDQ